MLSARPILLCPVLAAALIVGCGGDEGGAGAEVEAAIVTAASTDDPADCERFHTQRFLEQTFGLEGEAAVAACRADVVDPEVEDAESVTVTGVEVDGTEAQADAAFVGSDLDRQTPTFGLVEEDGDWKIDELVRFVRFDREALLEALAGQMVDLARETGEPKLAACLLAWMESLEDEALEAMVTDPDRTAIEGVALDCARRLGGDQSA